MTRFLMAGLLALTIAAGLPLASPTRADAQLAAPMPDPIVVVLDDAGVAESVLVAEAGQSIVWRNDGSAPRTLTSPSGVIDSGPVPPGGAYAASFAGPGLLDYEVDTGQQAKVAVGGALPGATSDLLADALPDMGFPLSDPADQSIHPTLARTVSRTRILLGFVPGTTVGTANAALVRAGTPLAGTLPSDEILLVLAPDTPDLSALDAALAVLRSDPAVEFAAMDEVLQPDAVPAGPSPSVVGNNYTWEPPATVPGAGADTSNWHLETVRGPPAWNLTEALADDARGTQVAVVDTGFQADHPDLQGRLEVFEPCFPSLFSGNCATNSPELTAAPDHGTHVAGIVGAGWAGATEGPRGANPVAGVVGLSWAKASSVALFSALLDEVGAGGRYAKVRAINLSQGVSVDPPTWLAAHSAFTCGPGVGDDAGATGPCLPSTEDSSLDETAQEAGLWARVARRASAEQILIATSAGNASSTFCDAGGVLARGAVNPPQDPSCPWLPMDAAYNSGLNWLDRNWEGLAGGTNPILVVESIGGFVPAAPGPTREVAAVARALLDLEHRR